MYTTHLRNQKEEKIKNNFMFVLNQTIIFFSYSVDENDEDDAADGEFGQGVVCGDYFFNFLSIFFPREVSDLDFVLVMCCLFESPHGGFCFSSRIARFGCYWFTYK